MTSLLCRIGVHDWKEKERIEYPTERFCLRCGKEQQLLYDFLTFTWCEKREQKIGEKQ